MATTAKHFRQFSCSRSFEATSTNGASMQAATDYRSMRNGQGPNRAEEAITNTLQRTRSYTLATAPLWAQEGQSSGQPVAQQPGPSEKKSPREPSNQYPNTFSRGQEHHKASGVAPQSFNVGQILGLRNGSGLLGRRPASINPAPVCGNWLNSSPTQHAMSNQIPPSPNVAQEPSLVSSRFRRTSLEAAELNQRRNQRHQHHQRFGAALNIAPAPYPQPQQKRNMDTPVTPANTNRSPSQQCSNASQPTSEPPMVTDERPSSPTQGSGAVAVTPSWQISKSRVTIAISGAPTSGKTTLAYLLACVFEGTTMEETGITSAQSMYPIFNGRIRAHPNSQVPITKTSVIAQTSYFKPDPKQWPEVKWTELYPYSPAGEVMDPLIGAARALADMRGNRPYERYFKEAYEVNTGVDPRLVSSSSVPSGSRLPRMVPPTPVRITKEGPNKNCRGAVDWSKFCKAINDGMGANKNQEGVSETEGGRKAMLACHSKGDPDAPHTQLFNRTKIDPLREQIRAWIRAETANNDFIGFPGRAVLDGSLREIFIFDGSMIFLQNDPIQGAGTENLMKACDVKLFLPTLETEAIKRTFSRPRYIDPPRGTREKEQTWMFEGYFGEVLWKQYESDHAWIFENGDVTNQDIRTTSAAQDLGIQVRDFYAAHMKEKGHKYEGKRSGDETLDWAVHAILAQLSIQEDLARQNFFVYKMYEVGSKGTVDVSDVRGAGTAN